MMSQIEIDVSRQGNGNGKNTLAKLAIAALLVAGVTLSAAGMHHKKEKAQTSISWHNVSDTLHQVEVAKADLFATLRSKSPQ